MPETISNKKWRTNNPNYRRDYYENNKERIREYQRNWRLKNKESYLPKKIAKTKEWEKRNREKLTVYAYVQWALRTGKIKKEKCRDCKSKKVHAHHANYKKRLDIIWLCPVHHGEEHKRINDKKINAKR